MWQKYILTYRELFLRPEINKNSVHWTTRNLKQVSVICMGKNAQYSTKSDKSPLSNIKAPELLLNFVWRSGAVVLTFSAQTLDACKRAMTDQRGPWSKWSGVSARTTSLTCGGVSLRGNGRRGRLCAGEHRSARGGQGSGESIRGGDDDWCASRHQQFALPAADGVPSDPFAIHLVARAINWRRPN